MRQYASVILCTHNPRFDFLSRVLKALKDQSLRKSKWELLFIDNASEDLLSVIYDVSWHPQAYHIREDKIGLTEARLRGIKEAVGEIIVFVDDDVVLDSEYLKNAISILHKHPYIGSIGGKISAESKGRIPNWMEPYFPFLAIHEWGDYIRITNDKHAIRTLPCGAGLVIRRDLAVSYTTRCADSPRRNLGRKGGRLAGSEDTDIVFGVIDQGFCVGYFPILKSVHLMPRTRLKLGYIAQLRREGARSRFLLDFMNGTHSKLSPRNMWIKLLRYAVTTLCLKNPRRWWIDIHAYLGSLEGSREALNTGD